MACRWSHRPHAKRQKPKRLSILGAGSFINLWKPRRTSYRYKQCGAVSVARTPERMTLFRRQLARARCVEGRHNVSANVICLCLYHACFHNLHFFDTPTAFGIALSILKRRVFTRDCSRNVSGVHLSALTTHSPTSCLVIRLLKVSFLPRLSAEKSGGRVIQGFLQLKISQVVYGFPWTTASPTDLTAALLKRCSKRGCPDPRAAVRVDEVLTRSNALTGEREATGVKTACGAQVSCDVLVLCGGQWSRQFGAKAGVTVPLHSAEHFYVITMKWRVSRGTRLCFETLTVLSMPVNGVGGMLRCRFVLHHVLRFCVILIAASHCIEDLSKYRANDCLIPKTEMEFPTPCLMIHCAAFVVASSGVQASLCRREGCYGPSPFLCLMT